MTDQQRRRVHEAMVRLADGDRGAFDEVFDGLWPALLAFTRRALPATANAEDVAQQALVKLFSRISEFDSTREGVAWAFGIASFEIKTERRRVQRRREAGDIAADLAAHTPSPEQAVIDDDLREALTAVLGKLSDEDRAALSLERSGRGPVDAAGRKRRQRALARLRAMWRALYA